MENSSFDLTTAAGRMTMVAASGSKPTLNRKPAHIGGYGKRFAIVTDHKTGLSAEWSWPTVELIMHQRGGKFRS